jgi:RHS repeat-associated protein
MNVLYRYCVTVLMCILFTHSVIVADAQVTGGPPATSLPTSAGGGDLGSAKLNFQPDLFTGRFTYTILIFATPGRGNSQPSLSLNYNSSLGNGWCGVGWQLELGKIERETKFGVPVTWATNAAPSGYDDSKSFTVDFNGVQGHLVQISGNGLSPVQYQLQVDKSFIRFFYYNNVSNAYWFAVDKNGTQYLFGEGPANRMDNNQFTHGFGSETFRWELDRVIDANGNLTIIDYANVVANTNYSGVLYPSRLTYNWNANSPVLSATNTIDFVLTNRLDLSASFISGREILNGELLSQIIVRANGNVARRYVLAYTNSTSTLRSLLASVTEYGSDNVTTLPPTTFNYQVQQSGFGPIQNWNGITGEGKTDAGWYSVTAATNNSTFVKFMDIDGDGLPDRIMRTTNAALNGFVVQRNTGTNFTGAYFWGGLTNMQNGNITVISNGITKCDFFDINGDGRPDYVLGNSSANWLVQLNTGACGTNAFSPPILWGTLATGEPDIIKETNSANVYVLSKETLIDLNGDGLPDRVLIGNSGASSVQYNTGSGFGPSVPNGLISYFYFSFQNNFAIDSEGSIKAFDMNGDGLPDMVTAEQQGTNLNVSFSAGLSLGYGANFAPLNGDWSSYNLPGFSLVENSIEDVQLIDVNGDGLLDRVMTKGSTPYNSLEVQFNTGLGFGPLVYWTNVLSQTGNSQAWDSGGYTSSSGNASTTVVTLVDINGDGLPDRVMCNTNSVSTNWFVQLNLGPFPDLLCSVSNGIGSSVQVTYLPSTKYDNTDRTWTNDPWLEGAKSLLPFPVYTVSSTVVNDGFGNSATNTYVYKHGFFDTASREFRGFNMVAASDPYGTKTVTYFHQSGGFNDAVDGEFADAGSFSKKGMPYRVETWGTNGLLYQVVLNKVVENVLNTNGWYFPEIAQTTVLNYEGLNTYRATAVQYGYDTNTENLLAETDYGEVTNFVFNGQTFTDIGNDSVYKWMTYTNLGNILNRPSDIKITSDSAGANRLQENLNTYDANGNLKVSQSWLNTAGMFITTATNVYDQNGNLTQTTDAAGITTTTTYDSTFEQYPANTTTGTFTSSATFGPRSGVVLTATDAKGLVTSNIYDAFFRLTASYISTNSYGPPTLWQSRTTYSLGGISGGVSHNYVFSQVNNAVDEVNGYQSYTYSDGLGRTVETRDESETSGQDRVANTVYDLRGNPYFSTLPYFSSGTAFTVPSGAYLGALTAYDSIGRAFQTTPAVNGTFTSGVLTGTSATGGDTGSPVGSATTAFVDGSNPWATVVTDANGKVRKSYRDAYGRTIQTLDIASSGNVSTAFNYDIVGNMTNVTDNAGNSTVMGYDSLGRKISMVDPDMGTWSYFYDNDGRLTQQTDAKANVTKFFYADQIGRLTSKQIYNPSGALTGTITYTYDTSDDSGYTVYPGQLYKVTDLQGYERFSYDVRGRVLKDARFLGANAIEYLTQASYDDADRIQQLVYPGNAATLQYTYDVAGHTTQVASTAGTGTNEVFYTPSSFNAVGQLTGYTNGNGVITSYGYFANSQRLHNLTTGINGINYQNLSYTYDNVSDVSSIYDGAYSGSASAAVSSISYDDLYRITSLNSTARGVKSYGYNSIGNILTNQDLGSGVYLYGAKPHAVISANGINYAYDACGNMTNRGNQTLVFDSQNQLTQVITTNDSVSFGYDDNGERLWRAGTNGYTVWIGGIYEINNGKVLCHVMAGGQLIATFEPQCNAGLSKIFGEPQWYVASGKISSAISWPFREGRGRWTMLGGTWAVIIGLCTLAARGVRLKRYEVRRAFGLAILWRQAVTLLCITSFLAGSIGDVEAAPAYNPVFYFYHPDALGSSNILTDRSGNLVQHYEYATFGQTSYQNNNSAFPVSNRYTGQISDDETGLYYYGGRYYDSQLGRFIQPDPTIPDPTDSQSYNRYSYCRNNPLNVTDPSGFDDGGSVASWGDIGNLFGGVAGGWVGDAADAYNGANSLNFTYISQQASDGSSAFAFEISSGNMFNGGWDISGSDSLSANGNPASASLQSTSWTPPMNNDGFNPGSTFTTSTFANFVQPDAPTTKSSSSGGGGWLSAVTNAAGLLSALPLGPVSTFLGLVNAGGEALQGNYLAAGIGVGGALLAVVGLGVLGKLGQEAAEAGVRFGQQGISATFRNGEFAGQSIKDVAAGLRSGAINPSQLPLQTITREGITYTMNNRSLMALRQAGMEPTVLKDVTGNAFFENQLTVRLGEMGGHPPAGFVPVIRPPKP